MDKELSGGEPWLAGDKFSLADIGYASYIRRLEHLQLEAMWENFPYLSDWYDRLQQREAFRVAILDWDNAAYINNMKKRGAQEWPLIKRVIASKQ